MIDLTPLDVRNKRGDFKKLMRGYDPQEVDVFLEIVAERLEMLTRENMALKERTSALQSQVSSQTDREQAVQAPDVGIACHALREFLLCDLAHGPIPGLAARAGLLLELVQDPAEILLVAILFRGKGAQVLAVSVNGPRPVTGRGELLGPVHRGFNGCAGQRG